MIEPKFSFEVAFAISNLLSCFHLVGFKRSNVWFHGQKYSAIRSCSGVEGREIFHKAWSYSFEVWLAFLSILPFHEQMYTKNRKSEFYIILRFCHLNVINLPDRPTCRNRLPILCKFQSYALFWTSSKSLSCQYLACCQTGYNLPKYWNCKHVPGSCYVHPSFQSLSWM